MTKRRPVPLTALSTAIGLVALAVPTQAHADCSEAALIGSICITGATYCPVNTVEANGALYPIDDDYYLKLFALLKFKFGGSAKDKEFGVPDLRGRSIIGTGQGPGLTNAPYGEPRGADTVKQYPRHLPAHTHSVSSTYVTVDATGTITVVPGAAEEGAGTNAPTAGNIYSLGGVGGKAKYGPYTKGTPGDTPAMATGHFTLTALTPKLEATGAQKAMLNLPPQQVVRFCIVVDGPFPQRP